MNRFSGFSETKNHEQRTYTDYYSARNTIDRVIDDQGDFFFDVQKSQNIPIKQNKIYADQDSKKRDHEMMR